MNTILLIALIVAIVVVVAMAVMLAFDRRQNHIVDSKLIAEVEKNLALEERVKALTQEAHEAELKCRVLEVQNKNLQEKAESDKAELEKLQSSFRQEFKNLANDILEEKQKSMTASNKESIELVLKPLRDNIKDFRERVESIYSAQNEQTGSLKAELKNLMELNNTITAETKKCAAAPVQKRQRGRTS